MSRSAEVIRSARGVRHHDRHGQRADPHHSRPAVGVEVAAGPARVVGVQAERHVEGPRARTPRSARPRSASSSSTASTVPGPRAWIPVVRASACGRATGRGRPCGVLQGGDVLRDGRDAVRLGDGLDDQPLRARRDGQLGGLHRAGAGRRPRSRETGPCRCRSRRARSACGSSSRAQPPQRGDGLRSWPGFGLLGVAERDAAHPVLLEEHALQHADARPAAPAGTAAPACSRRSVSRCGSAVLSDVGQQLAALRASCARTRRAASGRRAGSTRPGRPRWRASPAPIRASMIRRGSAEPCRTCTGKSGRATPSSSGRVVTASRVDDRVAVERQCPRRKALRTAA